MEVNIKELQKTNALNLSNINRERHMYYRQYTKLIKDIYDYAKLILESVFKEGYSLPVDVITLAQRLGFTITIEDISDYRPNNIPPERDYFALSQLKMRKKMGQDTDCLICGGIQVSKELDEYSIRFTVAQQLGYYALREQNKIGLYLDANITPWLYQLSSADEMLANIFAYALLLPYHLYEEEREKYERIKANHPLDYGDWISHLRSLAQIPEYQVAIAFQEIKNLNIFLRWEEAKKLLYARFEEMGISNPEEIALSIKILAITINNLSSLGFSKEQIATFLFSCDNHLDNCNIAEYIMDCFINSKTVGDNYPKIIIEYIISRLEVSFSTDRISEIMGLSNRIAGNEKGKSLDFKSLLEKKH